ncbi:MAG: hypothetical protein WAZ48_10980 [Lysobacteraceae bacterium]
MIIALIASIGFASAAHAQLGPLDYNGDGIATDYAYTNSATGVVTITHGGGKPNSIFVVPPGWGFAKPANTDATNAGMELYFLYTGTSLSTNVIIVDDTRKTKRAYSNAEPGTWAIANDSNLNGAAGKEIYFFYSSTSFGTNLVVIDDTARRVRKYSAGEPNYWSGASVSELDGMAGNEVYMVYQGTGPSTNAVVIDDRLHQVRKYTMASARYWSAVQVLNTNGQPGNELVFSWPDGSNRKVVDRNRGVSACSTPFGC